MAPQRVPALLPQGRVFTIQVGSQSFQLSGASLSSDGPSYFTNFFQKQLARDPEGEVRTLYMDRDAETFRDISLHLQGYNIRPRDSAHFVRLLVDAQLYSLPKLCNDLYQSEIYLRIGGVEFCIPKNLFSSPGDSPNFFTFGFGAFFSSPKLDVPGVTNIELLRPPAIRPPEVPNRCPTIFNDLLQFLRGYDLHIRNEEHRSQLLRDCRYFHLRGLEQKLIKHSIDLNTLTGREEILVRLEDLRWPGLSTTQLSSEAKRSNVTYSRPYVDKVPRELIIEISTNEAYIDAKAKYVAFAGDSGSRIILLISTLLKQLALSPNSNPGISGEATGVFPTLLQPGRRFYRADLSDSVCELDGVEVDAGAIATSGIEILPWKAHKSQWKIIVEVGSGQDLDISFQAVYIMAKKTRCAQIKQRGFLQ
jgi:hypothetical protein